MKAFSAILFLAQWLQGVATESEIAGKKCWAPALCTQPKSKYVPTEWIQISPSVCEVVSGPKGEIGPLGPKGENGTRGESGPTGPKGNNGSVGDIGLEGPQGENGTMGDIGPAGRKGDNGTTGDVGSSGPKGENGTLGEVGPKGIRGKNGTRGETGPIGESECANDTATKAVMNILCPVNYDDKCFFLPFTEPSGVTKTTAAARCQKYGGMLANIYSQAHMDELMAYIREQTIFKGGFSVHLGLTYNPQTDQLVFRNGTLVPDELKRSTTNFYPRDLANTALLLYVNNVPSSTYNYLGNSQPTSTTLVLCEIA